MDPWISFCFSEFEIEVTIKLKLFYLFQRAKKVVSDSPGLVDFAIGLVTSVFNLPDGQVMFFEEFEQQKNCETNSACQKAFGASCNEVWASEC